MAVSTKSFGGQVRALIYKNWLLAVKRQPIGFFLCIYGLPIAFLAILIHIPSFMSSSDTYGTSTPRQLPELADILNKKLVIVKPSNLGPDVDRVADALTESLDANYVQILDSESELATVCLANLRGVSGCFASVSFMDSPETKGSYYSDDYYEYKKNHTWEYIVRVDPASDEGKFDVPKHKTDAENKIMPVQFAVNRAITNSTTPSPETMAYTTKTQEEHERDQREDSVALIGSLFPFAMFSCFYFIIYRHTALITSERESGLAHLVDAMGGSGAGVARVLSWLVVFNLSTIPVFILFGVLYWSVMFPTSGAGVVIGWQVLQGMSVNSSTIFAASFFRRSRVSAVYVIGAFLLITVGTQVYGFTSDPDPEPPGAYVLSFLFVSANSVLFLQQMILWEMWGLKANVKIQPGSYYGIKSESYKLTQAEMLAFLAVQIIVYPILAMLVEKYMQGIDFRNRSFTKKGDASATNAQGTVIAETFDLKKRFVPNFLQRFFCCGRRKSVTAVDGFSLKSHKGQILCLVGPNGSGKTTTLHMMAGFISPSSGSVAFNATSAQIGICPQSNTLWEDLTVMEHMKIWSRLKATNLSPFELDQTLIACDLELKRDCKARALSGGQKRKLQLACMFVGDASICLIDECTSGLDPLSRRAIWEILLAQRAKRSIIFTTHFLDEVDVLADHIIVLTKGKVKCQGPTAELKNLHGGGYKVLVPRDAARSQQVEYPSSEHQDQIVYTTPDSRSAAALHAQFTAAGITSTSISGPQVEDVFLRVADDADMEPSNNGLTTVSEDDFKMTPAETTSFWKQTRVLFRKRLTVLRSFWTPYFFVLLLPLLITPYLKDALGEFYSQPECRNLERGRLYGGWPGSFYAGEGCDEGWCDYVTVGPKSAGETLREMLKDDYFETNEIEPKHFSNFATVVKNRDDFLEDVTDRKYLRVGGIYNGSDGEPSVLAFQHNYNEYFTMMTLWSQMDSGVQILARQGGFAQNYGIGGDSGVFWAVVFTLLQALYPAAFVLYPAIEKASKVRSLEYANGVQRGPLWVAYGLFDGMFVTAVSVGITAIMDFQMGNMWNGPIWIMLPVQMLYGFAAMLLGYVISHFINGPLKTFLAVAGTSLAMFAIGAVSFAVGSGYAEVDDIDSMTLGLSFGLNLFMPIANVFRATLVGLNVLQIGCRNGALSPPESIYAYGGPILYLALQSAGLLLLIIWIEGDLALFRRKTYKPGSADADGEKAHGMRSDEVIAETHRVEQSETDLLRTLHVDKSFGSNHAVDNVSFGLPPSDVMALIGPNGAGKSTLVNVIQRELSCDSGKIFLQGEDSRTRSAQKFLGVCPQHDALDLMNTREHLNFYARIKGIKNVKGNVDHVMKRLGLTPHASTMASKLSGGNKRKLSLAIALMGTPPVLVLDEPTSAMDAVAKRRFWSIIRDITPGRSVLLTTHSMEEADALATRTAIISRKLLAVGTTQVLREKYSNVHYVSIQLASAPNSSREEMEMVREWVHDKIPNAQLEREILGGQVRFTVPGAQERGRNPVAEVIELLEREKDNMGIEYYSIGGATLERVFLNVVRENNVSEADGKVGRGARFRRMLRWKK